MRGYAEPFRRSLEEWVPRCAMVYNKFHIIQHANGAVDEVGRAAFFRKGRKMRDLNRGKKWLLLSRWKNLIPQQRGVGSMRFSAAVVPVLFRSRSGFLQRRLPRQ